MTMEVKQSRFKIFFKDNALMLLNVLGIIIGLALGFGLREVHPSKDALMWIALDIDDRVFEEGFPGELFLRMLRMLIVPLIVCSVISGAASMDPKSNGKISLIAIGFIVVTHLIACTIGVVLSILIKPGVGGESTDADDIRENLIETQDIFADLFRNLIPNNLVETAFKQAQTQYEKTVENVTRNSTNGSFIDVVVTISKSNGSTGGVNVLGLITISTVFGVAISKLKKKAEIFLQFFVGATELILFILRNFFWAGPIGIASLVAVSIAPVEDIAGVFSRLGLFVVCVVVGLIIHQFIILPVIFIIFMRRNPFKFMLSTIRAILLGFASTSTAVAIPEMLVACDKEKVDRRVSRFTIPFCVTLNADGSVIYITCAAVFIIQLSLGTVTPAQSAIIVDRLRSQTNVVSHTMITAITYSLCKKSLKQNDEDILEVDIVVNGDTKQENHVTKL
ncbi:hypothetical protein LOTGIDRAFT_156002 [Lottia gigantea]|uniref:Amino acid transporter n=1 Tax=Lottia gigantea TaxID=225164 RepID=V4B380_LOTGI|nr:hypothetical protein LOTGIDRAFT_156002 [Lottia gigantea]ESP04778.1 hypothetical protein LOTGIDRAFT_156002 [Lottia gigantea]